MVIDFTEDGQAQSLHRDELDLGFLGKKVIERATLIEFDVTSQTWQISLPQAAGGWKLAQNGRGFGSYNTARKAEVEWLDLCRSLGCEADSKRGEYALYGVRRAAGI